METVFAIRNQTKIVDTLKIEKKLPKRLYNTTMVPTNHTLTLRVNKCERIDGEIIVIVTDVILNSINT